MSPKFGIVFIGGIAIAALLIIDHDIREIALSLAMLVELMRVQ